MGFSGASAAQAESLVVRTSREPKSISMAALVDADVVRGPGVKRIGHRGRPSSSKPISVRADIFLGGSLGTGSDRSGNVGGAAAAAGN